MFNHLHCHTEYSVLDGYGSPSSWVGRLKELGMKAIAITEHGNIDSSIKMSKACKEAGIKLVVGCEFYICENMAEKNPQTANRHICIYAMNKNGWKNILEMLSEANIYGYHYKPRIDGQCLLGHLDGIIVSTACIISFLGTRWGVELFGKLIGLLPDRLFCEVMPHTIDGQDAWNQKVIKLAKENNLPIIATNDCHYPRKEDAKLQDICLAINSGADYDDPRRFRFDNDTFYLASTKEMMGFFQKAHPYIPDIDVRRYLANTQKLIDACEEFSLDKIEPDLPLAPIVPQETLKEEGRTEDDYFRLLIYSGLHQKRNKLLFPLKDYKRRIEEELAVLIPKHFSRYFLMVIDILKFCRENGIAVGPGRGSVGGCLCAWLTGITQVDPLKYNLLFARFQDPLRKDLPDIDCDFEMDRRDEVIDYIKAVYGEQNVAQITTFLTMKGKMALQDVARTFKIPREEVNSVTKLIDEQDELNIKFFRENAETSIRDFYFNHRDVVDYALAIQGTVRGYGKHAAGICISNHNLAKGYNGNLARRHGVLVSNWDKDEGEYMGLMKLDILGLTALSRIKACVNMVKANHGIDIRLEDIDVEDKKALKLIDKGDCLGIFQLGTYGLTKYCRELGIKCFKDVYNATALFRPGTLGSGMAQEFVDRRHGKKWKNIHPSLEGFTSDTEGIIVYQEQFMMMFKELAGFDWAECNKVRKVIAKSKGEEALNEYKDAFIKGCRWKSGLEEHVSGSIWDSIVSFSSYAFNLSHAVEYSVISMWDAWLKCYYRGEFYASCLSYLDEGKCTEMLQEAAREGIDILLPKYKGSDVRLWHYEPATNSLLMPFLEIVGVGEKQAQSIVGASGKKVKTFFGFRADFSMVPVKIRQILELIHADDFQWRPKIKDVKELKPYFKYNLREILNFGV